MASIDVKEGLMAVIAILEELEIPYYVGGSMASSAYGLARTTLDVDVAADLNLPIAGDFINRARRDFYVDKEVIETAVRSKRSFNIIHLATMIKVDIFPLQRTEFDLLCIARRKKGALDTDDPRDVFFCSPEDLVLHKLLWFRMGEETSERQWQDIKGVLKVQRVSLDMSYLTEWASRLGVDDLFDQILRELKNT